MAKKDKTLQKSATAESDSGKGKKKRLIIIIIAILIVLGLIILAVFFYFDNSSESFFGENLTTEESTENIQIELDSAKLPEQRPGETISPPPPEEPPPPPKKRLKRSRKRYYLKVGTCLYSQCQRDIGRLLKRNRLSTINKTHTKRVEYYELISESAFDLKRAEEKRRILDKYNKMIASPYLVVYKNKYKISFGQFPQREIGMKMQTHLAQLYPQVKLRFQLTPRKNKYTVTNVYTGPFSKSIAEKVRSRLMSISEVQSIEITKRP
ncbi:MAG: hypothetical protein GY866_34320 [Proteobacteria bacterium]|nr:hypothetical protein [Pseudomonadota bacterium]